MTTKNEEAIYTLYEERGDLCDDKVIASINERPFYLQANLDDVNDQIRLIENIRPEYQDLYFRKVFTDVICKAYEATYSDGCGNDADLYNWARGG